jgi:thioredoxin reductase
MKNEEKFDTVIIGGSYAGLSAAMSLARALQRVLIIDGGNPCNQNTPHSHNFLTQDGVPPAVISGKALEQVLHYPTASITMDTAVAVSGTIDNFEVTTATGLVVESRRILFTTGIKDIMPEIPGFADCWARSVIHCPFCHGYEYKGDDTGLLMNGDAAADHALFINNWAGRLTLFTNGKSSIPAEKAKLLSNRNIQIVEQEVRELTHVEGQLSGIILFDGDKHKLKVLYAIPKFVQHCTIPELLGCNISEQGYIEVDDFKRTSIPGIYAAGDNTTQMRSVSGSVAAGTMAGALMSKDLIMSNNEVTSTPDAALTD